MMLIADSGSTKTDWRIIDDQGNIEQARTQGFNPYYQSTEDIKKELMESLRPQVKVAIKEVYFYGAGCNNQERTA
jgi:N-acetylglucosamine kinase-like BadF-type ATPase